MAEPASPQLPSGDDGAASRGVLLAIAIVLLWLAGFCFFVAFEGSKLLKEAGSPDGAGLFKAMVGGLGQKVVDLQQGGP